MPGIQGKPAKHAKEEDNITHHKEKNQLIKHI
jgi:hypothetical protein